MNGAEAGQRAYGSSDALMRKYPQEWRDSFYAGMMFGFVLADMDLEVARAMLEDYYLTPHAFEVEEQQKDEARAIIAVGRST